MPNEEDYIQVEFSLPESGTEVAFIDSDNKEYLGWCDDFNTMPRKVTFFSNETQKPVSNIKGWCYWKGKAL